MNCPALVREILDKMARLRMEHTAVQGKFADKADINREHYSEIETSSTEIFLSTFLKICNTMNGHVWIFTDKAVITIFIPQELEKPAADPKKKVRLKRGKGKKQKPKIKSG